MPRWGHVRGRMNATGLREGAPGAGRVCTHECGDSNWGSRKYGLPTVSLWSPCPVGRPPRVSEPLYKLVG